MTAFSRTFSALAACLVLVGLAGCQGVPSPHPADDSGIPMVESGESARYHYLESLFTEKASRPDKAMEALALAIQADPDSSVLKRELVRLYLKQNQAPAALALAEELAQQDPDDVENLLLLARLKKDDQSEEELEPLLSRILELDPKKKEAYLRLGKIHMKRQDFTQALDLFTRMAQEFPDYYVAHFYLGEVQMLTQNPDRAIASYQKTLALEPALVEPRFRLFDIYRTQGSDPEFEKSMPLLEEILALEPEDERARLEMTLIFIKTGQTDLADQAFEILGEELRERDGRPAIAAAEVFLSQERNQDALLIYQGFQKLAPDNDQVNFFSAMAHEGLGDKATAIEYYLKVSPAHPHYKKMIFSIAYLYRDMDKPDEARLLLEEFHEQRPDDIDIITYLSSFYEEDQEYDRAEQILNKGLAHAPDNTTLLFRLGVIQDKVGEKETCIATMKRVIELDPRHASALNYLGYTYADLNILLDQAESLILRALEVKPDDGFITDSLGWVYYQQGKYAQAVAVLEKAARLSQFETIIAEHLGDAYAKAQRPKDAKAAYLKAIENVKDNDPDRVNAIREKIRALPPTGDDIQP